MSNQYRSVLAGAGGTGGDALVSEVLTGKTFTNDNGPQTGTMPNRGAVTQTIAPGGSYTIPEGYHNGSGAVTASPSLLDNKAVFSNTSPSIQNVSSPMTVACGPGNMASCLIDTSNYSSMTISSSGSLYGDGSIAFIKNDGTMTQQETMLSSGQAKTFDLSDYSYAMCTCFDNGGTRTITFTLS